VDLFDVDALDEDWPFEVDQQAAHLFKHPKLGLDDVADVWASDPMFYPAKPALHNRGCSWGLNPPLSRSDRAM